MKLIEMRAFMDKQGCIILPGEQLGAAGLKPGDEVYVTLAVSEEEMESLGSQLIISTQGVEVAVQLSGWQEDEDGDLSLPDELLEAAEIPEGSNLEIVCTTGTIVIMKSDILDGLPDELRRLFEDLGIHSDTVREVMRKDGYFV